MGELLRATFDLYRRNVRLVLAVTVPIVAIVTGVTSLGLGELSARFNPGPPVRDAEIDFAALELVTVPLISAMLARWVFLMRRGERIDLADLVANALEAFPAVLFVIVVWIVVSILGFVSLIVPGVYVFVSWYFVVQAVVIDGDRGFAAITRQRGARARALVAERDRGDRLPPRRVRAAGADRARLHARRPLDQLLRHRGVGGGTHQRRRRALPCHRRHALLPPTARGRRSAREGVKRSDACRVLTAAVATVRTCRPPG